MLPCGTPISWSNTSEICEPNLTWNCLFCREPWAKRGSRPLKSSIVQVFHDTMFPRCIVGFLQIEKHGNYMLFLYESFAYEAFKSHQLICSASVFAEATLHISDVMSIIVDKYVSMCQQRWNAVHVITGCFHKTTNGLERQHEELKYHYLANLSNGSMSDVMSIIVDKYMSMCQQRWNAVSVITGSFHKTTNGLERQHEELKYHYLANLSNGSILDVMSIIVDKYVSMCQQRWNAVSVITGCFHKTTNGTWKTAWGAQVSLPGQLVQRLYVRRDVRHCG